MSDQISQIFALHISTSSGAESGKDHVFAEVFDLEGDQQINSTFLRYKGKPGFISKMNKASQASEYVVYAPITLEAAERLRAVTSLLVQLNEKDALPLEYLSGKGLSSDAKSYLYDNQKEQLKFNCLGIVIMGCLVAGIDLEKIFDHDNHNANDFDTHDLSEIVWGADSDLIDDKGSVTLGDGDYKFNVFWSDKDNNHRVFATTEGDSGHSPAQAFGAVSQRGDVLDVMRKEPIKDKPFMALPPALERAACHAGIRIPEILR